MKVIKVEVLPAKDGDIVNATIVREQKKNDTWNRMEAFDVTSGFPESKREFLLDDDERIVVEAQQQYEVIYDRAQAAAVLVPSDPKKRDQKLAADAALHQRTVEEERRWREDHSEHRRRELSAKGIRPEAETRDGKVVNALTGQEIKTDTPPAPPVSEPGGMPKTRFETTEQKVQPAPKTENLKVPQPPGPQAKTTGGDQMSREGGATASKEVKK